jgi:hypothetical protein
MAFIKISRVLPEQTVTSYLNVDTIIWLQDIDGRCQIMTVDGHEIESPDNSDEILKLIKDAG